MKKYVALALSFAISFSSVSAIWANPLNIQLPVQDITINKENSFEINGITYTITQQPKETLKGYVYITDGSNFKEKELNISTVTYQGKTYTVDGISPSAFYQNNFIEKVTIPNTVRSIGSNAFTDCQNLKEIKVIPGANKYASIDGVLFNVNKDTIITYPAGKMDKKYVMPNNVKKIEQGAFYNNKNLETFVANSSLEEIAPYAFSKTQKLKEITNIVKLKTLGDYAFADSSIENIHLSTYLEKMGKGTFYNSNIKNIEIPYKIKSLPEYTFYNAKNLKTVSLVEGLTNIETFAFYGSGLTSFNAPYSLLSIDFAAFKNAKDLKTINFNDNLNTIKDEAFSNLPLITKISLNRDLKNIGKNVFLGSNNIEKIYGDKNSNFEVLDNSLYSLDKKELIYVVPKSQKTELNIPKETETIREDALSMVSSIDKINVDEKNEKLSSVEGVLYDKDKKKIIKFPPKKELINFNILPSVEEIAPYAFKNAQKLSGFISIHEKVNKIGKNAFDNTVDLDGFYVDKYNEHFSVQDDVLYNKDKTTLIKYPPRKKVNSFAMLDVTKNVESNAFENVMIENLTTGVNLSTIEKQVFLNSNIKNINIKEGVKTIKEEAFKGSKVKNIILPSTLEKIEDGVLSYLPNLKTVEFKSLQLKYFGYNMFIGSDKLEKVIVPINSYNNYKNYLISSNILNWQKLLQEYKPLEENNKK